MYVIGERLVVQCYGIMRYGLEANAAHGAYVGAEVSLQEALAQADALEYLGAAVGAYGADAHLGHNLEEALLHRLDVVGLGSLVVLLYLAALHEVVEYGVGEVRAECRRAVAEQQRGVHHLAYLAALHD